MKTRLLVLAPIVALMGCSTPDAIDGGTTETDGARADAPASLDVGGLDTLSSDVPLDGGVDPSACTGDVVHVATTGDDATGDGTEARPWGTLAHAAAQTDVRGTTIHVAAGEYLETDTVRLAEGVCLEGEGSSTIVRSTESAEHTAIVVAASPSEGAIGAQSIAHIAFDGELRTHWAIEIRGRSATSIHHCTFSDLFDSAVVWGGRVDNVNAPPTAWATGNSFHHNVVTNSAHCDALFCRGALFLGGQEGMLVYDNEISTTGRGPGANGWPIKTQVNEGYMRGLRIFGNTLTSSSTSTFDFAIELFRVTGTEVYDNTLIGSVDANFQGAEGPYDFGLRVYRNDISHATYVPGIGGNAGVVLEFASDHVEVFENHIRTVARCVFFTPRDLAIHDVSIHHNRCEDIRDGDAVRFQDEGPYTARDIDVDHNVFVAARTSGAAWGIDLPTGAGSSGVRIRNNVFMHFSGAAIVGGPASVLGGPLEIANNVLFDCGSDAPAFIEGMEADGTPIYVPAPSFAMITGTTTSDPRLDAELRPLDGSPVIDTGIDIGAPFLGAAPDRGYVEIR